MEIVKVSFRKPGMFGPFPNVIAAESTRHEGVSLHPYESLNLGLYTDDKKEYVIENRTIFFRNLGIPLDQVAGAFQVHKDHILAVTEPGQYEGYDALITNKKELFLTVTLADCGSILIYDPNKEVVGAVHAGWRGTVQEIGAKTVQKMEDTYGVNPANCYAYLGTCIDFGSFEVDEDVARHFQKQHKFWDKERGKYFVDLKNANRYQLENAGIPSNQIDQSPFCTYKHNHDFFSHRKERGLTGRMLAVIGMIR